jgi:hypothetical protein
MIRPLVHSLLFFLLWSFIASASAQISQFQFDPSKVPVGTVLHYAKSNTDGSRPTRISVYFNDREQIESFKWDRGQTSATLVQARMDWSRFSVREFRSLRLERGKPPVLKGTLQVSDDGKTIDVSFLDGKKILVNRWPWHSYDFDFTSLGATLPHMRDPEADVIFWRTDVVFVGESTDFAELGGVRLHFEEDEMRNDRKLRRYTIGGAGFQHLYGKLWTDASTGLLFEYEIPVGDEPGYKDVRLHLEHTEPMTTDQWAHFKKSKIGE